MTFKAYYMIYKYITSEIDTEIEQMSPKFSQDPQYDITFLPSDIRPTSNI